jgi:hypothetical protein
VSLKLTRSRYRRCALRAHIMRSPCSLAWALDIDGDQVQSGLLLVAVVSCLLVSPASGQATIRPSKLVRPPYPAMMRLAAVEGTVRFEARVTPAGRIDMRAVRVIESSHELLQNALKGTLPRWRFPARRGGARGERVVSHTVRWILLPADTTMMASCPLDSRDTTIVCARPAPSPANQTY